MSHGAQILAALRAEMNRLGRKPSDVEGAHVIDEYLATNGVKLKKVRKPGATKPRARDAVFDLLAKIDGQTGVLTRHAASRIAGAKKQILEVMPEASTDQVITEVEKRWARFCRKFTDPRNRTAMALVGHWGEFGDEDATDRRLTKAEQMNVYVEPASDWRKVAAVVLHCDPAALTDKAWGDLGVDYRGKILKEGLKHA